jgi:hypothetical protein
MSRGDAWSVSASLMAAALGYWVGGPTAAWICLIAGLIIAVFLHFTRPKKENQKTETTPTTSVRGFNPTNSQTANPHIEQHVHIGGEQAAKSNPPAVRKEKPPSLDALKPKEMDLHEDPYGIWFEASQNLNTAKQAIVIPFRNEPIKEPGIPTPTASSVIARLVFRNADGSDERHIDHGVWLNHYEYPVTFHSGDTRYLVIAVKLAPFVTFDNPNRNAFGGAFSHSSRKSIIHPQRITLWHEGTVEVSLVDYNDLTVFHGRFEYTLSLDKMTITRCPAPSQ